MNKIEWSLKKSSYVLNCVYVLRFFLFQNNSSLLIQIDSSYVDEILAVLILGLPSIGFGGVQALEILEAKPFFATGVSCLMQFTWAAIRW